VSPGPDPAPQLSGWGRLPVPGREIRSEDLAGVARSRPLTRGLGRSYGDASLPPAGALEVAGSALADRLLAFDPETGVLRAEAGLSLREILRLFLPRGFWPPASPGTAFVTLGGMVAADVHGKSHHRDGTFGRHVRSLRVLLADGRVVDCDRETHPGLFRATLGGMGLTGHILEVVLTLQRVPSAWIVEERRRYDGLDALLAALRAAAADWPYTVAWIDTLSSGNALGRGILFAGRWAEAGEAPLFPPPPRRRRRFPLDLPEWCLSPFAVRTFNALLFGTAPARAKRRLLSPEQFFYPLDVIEDWNRMYGRRGFTQYQCVLPERAPRGDAAFPRVDDRAWRSIVPVGAQGHGRRRGGDAELSATRGDGRGRPADPARYGCPGRAPEPARCRRGGADLPRQGRAFDGRGLRPPRAAAAGLPRRARALGSARPPRQCTLRSPFRAGRERIAGLMRGAR
jgi:FAD/FMN-containing dehydrogenase